MDVLSDPEQLRTRERTEFVEETRFVEGDEFGEYEALESHAVVGLTNDRGEVLLQNDGSHGWTLPAFVVSPGSDWVSITRDGVESLTGIQVELDTPELVRRIDFQSEERQTTMYTVIFRAIPVVGRPVADEFRKDRGTTTSVEWSDEVPSDQHGPVAADIRRFLD